MVPVGKKVRVITTANDVIHAWWVPAFGVKQDAIPGFVRDTWFRAEQPGIYRGQCAELCGKEHGFMPIVVEVVRQEEYAQWVAEQKQKMRGRRPTTRQQDVGRWRSSRRSGEKVYAANCAACHQADRQGRAQRVSRAVTARKIATGPIERRTSTSC